ncbi:MAG: hypothetical protein OK438_06150 [Thaumarchaeota archaeon]|nr:hypothetical protein [Nitrososphaerota archaeon]
MAYSGYLKLFVMLLLLTQAFSVVFLWSLDTFTQASEDLFAIFVSIDLLAFAMLSYIYRKQRTEEGVGGWVIMAGCTAILILMLGIVFA